MEDRDERVEGRAEVEPDGGVCGEIADEVCDDASAEAAAPAPAPDDEPDAQETPETPEQAAERQAREAAEREKQRACEAAERAEADKAAREERAQAAVERLSQGAGWAAQAGVYYDATHGVVRATAVSVKDAASAAPAGTSDADAAGMTDAAAAPDSDDARPAGNANSCEDSAAELDGAQVAEAQAGYIDPVVFGRMVAKVTQAVTRNPLQRELFYQVLAFCQESKPLAQVEQMVQALPGFAAASSNAYHFVAVLEHAGGLERFELDEDGEVVDEDRKRGLSEDEVDDLVAEYAFMTTPAGQAVVEQHAPRARIIELLGLVPERRDTYVELLEFLSEEPRTYAEVSQLLVGRDVLRRLDSRGNPERMQPSVFLDKLHDAAAIEWSGGWQLSEEGRAYLDELKGAQA